MASIQKTIKNRKQTGYTILEVMIVLSVSTFIFAAAIAGYARQNSKTHFTNAVRDMENKIQDVLNDISTGYYPQSNNFSCTRSTSTPVIPLVRTPDDAVGVEAAEQGTNQECIFLGKAVDVNDGVMDSYTIVGLRNSSTNAEELPVNVNDAQVRTIRSDIPGTHDILPLNASIHIEKIITDTGADSAGFAVVSGFGNGDVGGAGATTNQVRIASINPSYNFATASTRVVNNTDLGRDVTICIREPGNGRQASIKIGAGAQSNIETIIDGWAPECD